MHLGTLIVSWLRYHYMGSDMFGNRYYQERGNVAHPRRMVRYRGLEDASVIPPLWHAWLHYQSDKLPVTHPRGYPWQQPKKPNMTGTPFAHLPSGHALRDGKRRVMGSDIVPWIPGNKEGVSS
jgi:NADH:ubiquinone oxidoreductase subunit